MQLLSRNFRSSHPCAHQVLSVSFCARDALEQCTNFPVVAAAASSAGTAVTLSVASAAAAAAFVTAVVPACAPACTSLDICVKVNMKPPQQPCYVSVPLLSPNFRSSHPFARQGLFHTLLFICCM